MTRSNAVTGVRESAPGVADLRAHNHMATCAAQLGAAQAQLARTARLAPVPDQLAASRACWTSPRICSAPEGETGSLNFDWDGTVEVVAPDEDDVIDLREFL